MSESGKKFDLSKPYKTRDGREAKVLGEMPDGRYAGWVKMDVGGYCSYSWRPNGQVGAGSDCPLDLVNVPEKRKLWLNVYEEAQRACAHPSREDADKYQGGSRMPRVACLEIEYTVGEGLTP